MRTIKQRVILSASQYTEAFTVMKVLADCNHNRPLVTIKQVLGVLQAMRREGQLEQRALGIYRWKD